ncbi:MAG: glutamate formimidoyltransferase, partial [Planctomycetes bacterium]|nr:glutamate formimidoyltransferase [Planctomycetota bacterium]
MKRLIEIVPNFSEGKHQEVVDEITGVLKNIDDTWLLDSELDPDHNRCVVTVIVTPESLIDAGVAMLGKAIDLIDLNNHEGQHPRMGACDVFPLIPLSGVSQEQAKELCKELGKAFAEKFDLPTYLYEDAATIPWRKNLARIRRSAPLVEGGEKVPAFEWLRENIVKELKLRKPDFGPEGVHPTAGITAISMRFFLVAYNVNLETTDLEIAENIASKIRQRSGGFPAVKALGFELKDKNCVQVSMNLIDYRKTCIDKVFQAIETLANENGVAVRESELIGLVPQDAIDSTVLNMLGVESSESNITPELGMLPSIAYPAEKLSTKTEKFKSHKLQRKQIYESGNIDVLEDFAKNEGLKNGKILNPMGQDVANELFRRLIKLPQLH